MGFFEQVGCFEPQDNFFQYVKEYAKEECTYSQLEKYDYSRKKELKKGIKREIESDDSDDEY